MRKNYEIYFLQLEQQIIVARVITSSIAWSRTQTKLERTKGGEPCVLKSLFIGSLESSQ